MSAPDPTASAPTPADPAGTRSLPPNGPTLTPGGTARVDPDVARAAALRALNTPTYRPAHAAASGPLPSVPGYEVLSVLGRGGMGVVYHARQTGLNREVALKMILAGEWADPRARVRFLAEGEAVAAVRHPHVLQVYDLGGAGGRPFIATEYLPGGTLADGIRAGGRPPFEPRAAAGLVGKLARAVQAAHDQGIVHRDLKPANVLFDAAGEPKVADFGLAKRTASDLTNTGR